MELIIERMILSIYTFTIFGANISISQLIILQL